MMGGVSSGYSEGQEVEHVGSVWWVKEYPKLVGLVV